MALILIILFLVLAVVLRAVMQRFRTGDFGLRAASLDAPLVEILPGTLFVLSFASALVLITLGELTHITPITEFSNIIEWLFFELGVTGVAITVISQHQMGDSWRIGVDQTEKTKLKTGGLYSQSRNPIYFGTLLFWVALCGTFPHPLLWLCAVICWCCIEVIVRRIEEPYLRKLHGEQFKTYFDNTNRYLPL
jgi:protein-S-isoprenylcysteine O-methyltransferase Ste14